MGDRVETTCSRCGEEIVVMTAGEYLSSTDADLDFVLHAHERESHLATCPSSVPSPAPLAAHTIACRESASFVLSAYLPSEDGWKLRGSGRCRSTGGASPPGAG